MAKTINVLRFYLALYLLITAYPLPAHSTPASPPLPSSTTSEDRPRQQQVPSVWSAVKASRLRTLSWTWVDLSGTHHDHSFKYDPYLSTAEEGYQRYCDMGSKGTTTTEGESSIRGSSTEERRTMCGDGNVRDGVVNAAAREGSWVGHDEGIQDVLSYVGQRISKNINGEHQGGLGYLRNSDMTTAEFVMYPREEIVSMMSLEACGGKGYLRHGRSVCQTPVPLFLKKIGTCPMSALEGVNSFPVVPSNFTCPQDEEFISNAKVDSPNVWLTAGGTFAGKQNSEHAIVAFYLALNTAYEIAGMAKEQRHEIMSSALINLGTMLGTVNDYEGMALCYKAALAGAGGWNTESNMAAIVKLVLYVPPMVQGGGEEVERFRRDWLSDAKKLVSLLERSTTTNTEFGDVLIENDVWKELGIKVSKVKDPVMQIGQTLFHLAHQGENDREHMEVMSKLYDLILEGGKGEEGGFIGRKEERGEGKKIRVGFVSTLMSDHSIGRMMVPISRALSTPPHSDTFEVVVVGRNFPTYLPSLRDNPKYGPPEGEDVGLAKLTESHEDKVIRFTCQSVQETAGLPRDLNAAKELLRDLQLDVVIFPDIGMDAMTYFLSRERFAEIQLAWWGHPISTGMESFDYYFGLDVEIDEAGENQYSEQLIRMQSINTAPFASIPDGPEIVDELSYFGIQEVAGCEGGIHVYMVLGRLFKIHHEFEEMMFRILEKDECGVIVLISEKTTGWNTELFERIKAHHSRMRAEGNLGVNVIDRIRFVAYWNYVRIMAHSSVILDTYPYGGCLTAQEAMSNGKVVVTLPSKYIRGRFTKNIYLQMGQGPEKEGWPIASDKAEYVDIAVRVARNQDGYREATREKMRKAWDNESVHKVKEVGQEWAEMIMRAVKGDL